MYVAVVFFPLRDVDSGQSVPHYHVISHKMHEGVISAVGAFIRKWLLEDVYRRIGAFGHSSSSHRKFLWLIRIEATMFPETANWLTPADEQVFFLKSGK